MGTGDDGTFTKDFYAYNAASNSWTAKANFGGSPRYGATAFAVNNFGYVGLGYDTTLQNADQWFYNPVAGVRALGVLKDVYHNSVGRNGEWMG